MSQQLTVGHSKSQQLTVGHSRSQQVTVGHSRSQQVTVFHSSSQQVTVSHSSSQQVTVSHSSSQQVTVSHSRLQQVTCTQRNFVLKCFLRIHCFFIAIFHFHNPSGRTMALGLSQGSRYVGLTTFPLSYAECHEIWEPKSLGTLRACPGLQRDCCTFTFTRLKFVIIAGRAAPCQDRSVAHSTTNPVCSLVLVICLESH